MAEQINYTNYASENLVARLYYFKEAAREYLEQKNVIAASKDDTLFERMFVRYTHLVKDLAPTEAEQKLKKAAAPMYDILLQSPNRDFATKSWFLDNVDKKTLEDMAALLKEGQKLQQRKEKLEQKAQNTEATPAAGAAKDSPEAQLFKAEITRLIQRTNKYSDEDKKTMLDVLNTTTEITYTRKKSQITYSFSGYEIAGFVADGNVDMRNRAGQKIYSSGEQFDKEFAKGLKSRGKVKTAYGETAKQAVDSAKKEDKKQTIIKKQVAEIDKQLSQLETEKQAQFEKMIKSVSPAFLIADMVNPNGIMSGLTDKDTWEDARENLIEIIYSDKAVWSAYMPQKENAYNNQMTRFDAEVEKVFSRHNERDKLIKAGRAFYYEFEKLATDDKKQFNADKLDDEMLKKIFQKSVMMIGADLPLGVKQEVVRQEIFRQALTRDGYIGFDMKKFQMMNRLLMLDGMKIEFQEKKIEKKLQTDSARSFSVEILADMRKGNALQQKHKTEAFLYYLGKAREEYKGKNLNDTERNPIANVLFAGFSEFFYGQTSSNPRMKSLWTKFINDSHNLKQADAMYQMFHKIRVPGVRVEKMIQKLASGSGINDENSLVQQSKHHLMYRRFAGFYDDNLDRLKKLFNAPEHVIDTVAVHPALKDMHRDVEHRFDMGEEYLYQRENGQIVFGAYSSGKVGDTLLVPVVCVKNDKGQFEPLMKENMLLVSSFGKVETPHIPDQPGGTRQYQSSGITFS